VRGADTRHIALLPPLPRDFRAICGKKTVTRGTADYADEKDAADEWKQHQRRTEGSQSAYIRVICGKRTVVWELQITQIYRIPQMNGNPISGNLRISVFICG
jgi:hypothetical protein